MFVEQTGIKNLNSHTSMGVTKRVYSWIKTHAGRQNISVNAYLMQELGIAEDWSPYPEDIDLPEDEQEPQSPRNYRKRGDVPVELIKPAILAALEHAGGSGTAKEITDEVANQLRGKFGPEWYESQMHARGYADRSRIQKLIASQFDLMLKARIVLRPVRGLWRLNNA